MALVVLATAILGAAAAQAASWRVLVGSELDTGTWAALHQQVEELTAGGYDRAISGSRVLGGRRVHWTVFGADPKVVMVVAEKTYLGETLADTIRLVLRPPVD